jgi:hypothetical protein
MRRSRWLTLVYQAYPEQSVLGLIHPTAWKGYSANFGGTILHKPPARAARMVYYPARRLLQDTTYGSSE